MKLYREPYMPNVHINCTDISYRNKIIKTQLIDENKDYVFIKCN